MLISESVVRSFIRSILFESHEKVSLSEISFSPDQHHFETSSYKNNVSNKYAIYDTPGPKNKKKENEEENEEENILLDNENNPIEASEIVEQSFTNDHIYNKIIEIKNQITDKC